MAKKLRLLADHRVALLNAPAGFSARLDLPATPLWVRRDVLGEITSVTGYRPVAFVAVDDDWTALRFKRA